MKQVILVCMTTFHALFVTPIFCSTQAQLDQQLVDAVYQNSNKKILAALNAGADANVIASSLLRGTESLLARAVRNQNTLGVKILLSKNANPNLTDWFDTFKTTPLYLAVLRNDLPTVQALLASDKIDPNLPSEIPALYSRPSSFRVPLERALADTNKSIIKALLQHPKIIIPTTLTPDELYLVQQIKKEIRQELNKKRKENLDRLTVLERSLVKARGNVIQQILSTHIPSFLENTPSASEREQHIKEVELKEFMQQFNTADTAWLASFTEKVEKIPWIERPD
jgi:hypothetical protein